MMIIPSNNDTNAVFALLSAVADPEASKAALSEIKAQSDAYAQAVETQRAQMKQDQDDLSIQKADIEEKITLNQSLVDSLNSDLSNKQQQLSDGLSRLSIDQTNVFARQADLDVREASISARENTVSMKEVSLSDREDRVSKAEQSNATLKSDLESKELSLRQALGL